MPVQLLSKYASVAPFVGAWIEIYVWIDGEPTDEVAPFVGAWIEIVPLE